MTPLRPAGMILAVALIAGVIVVSIFSLALRSQNSGSPSLTPTPPLVSEPGPTPDVGPDQDDDQAVGNEVDADQTPVATAVATPGDDDDLIDAEPTATPAEDIEPLTDEELERYQPNELGHIMVLMYHRFDDGDTMWSRTIEQFREDLQWLYDNDFYVIPIRDYIRNEINAPAGKRPVVLTFDDGTANQFRYVTGADGSVEIDPESAIGVLEEFFTRYDDFGRGGLFSILPLAPFAWPDASEQMEFAQEKLQWLIDNGYELGNHTVGHVNLREISDEEIKAELAGAENILREYVPEAEISVLAVPFGMYPQGGDTTLFRGFEYEGEYYELEAALMVGAEPAPSPVHIDFDPMWIPRINADDNELGRWFSFVEDNPGIMYVSDGNPNTITIPETVHPWLVNTFDEGKAEGKTIIRY